MAEANALILEDKMGIEIVPFLIKKKINKYPDVKYNDLQLVNYTRSSINDIRVNLVLPTMNKKSIYGGISTALNFFDSVAEAYNAEKRIIVTDTDLDIESKKEYRNYNLVSPDSDMVCKGKITLCEMTEKKSSGKKIDRKEKRFFYNNTLENKICF